MKRRTTKTKTDGALEFLKRAADGKHRIVCSGDLTTLQIAEARACGRFYVEPGGGLGWALLPWELTTLKEKAPEKRKYTIKIELLPRGYPMFCRRVMILLDGHVMCRFETIAGVAEDLKECMER